MKKRIGLFLLIAVCALAPAVALAQQNVIEFGPERWTIAAGKVVDFLGRKAFMGAATLKDVEFENGVIEFDVAASTDRARSYPGVTFRAQADGSWERFYIRPHRSALYNDVLQYVAAFNGVDSWQFYSGPGATAIAVIPVNQWIHVKLEVSGVQARVFVGAAAQPALVIPRLKHGSRKGTIGVLGPADGTAYFSNFSYRADNGLAFDPPPPVDETPGIIRNWKISKPFPAEPIDMDRPLEAQNLGDPGWKDLISEPSGLVDIARLYRRSQGPDLVFARTVITADKDEVRKFDFGYSDVVSIFINGQPVYSGNSQYQGRDTSFLGIVGWFDSVFLPLKKGPNELTLAVAEVSGGWGFMVRDSRGVFAVEGLTKEWETPQELSNPESVAYDSVRKCLYVSNYDPANPSGAEGKQAVSKLSLDGKIENLTWVSGLANPTGLVVVKDKLYAVERRSIAEIDIPGRKILAHYPIPGAGLPNDIAAAPDGSLYVTDSMRATIFKWTAGKVEEWLRDPRIARPNGIIVDGPNLIVGVNIGGRLKSIDLQTKEIKTIANLGTGTIDGLEKVGTGIYLVSHNEGRLFRVAASGGVAKLLDLSVIAQNIADFTYADGRVFMPTFSDNRVLAYKLGLSTIMSERKE
jgi:DNA-binding beta-propeller fold protein YncE